LCFWVFVFLFGLWSSLFFFFSCFICCWVSFIFVFIYFFMIVRRYLTINLKYSFMRSNFTVMFFCFTQQISQNSITHSVMGDVLMISDLIFFPKFRSYKRSHEFFHQINDSLSVTPPLSLSLSLSQWEYNRANSTKAHHWEQQSSSLFLIM